MNLRELAARLGCTLRGDGAVEVSRVRGIDDAGPGDLTFVSNPRYVSRLATTRASAVIVTPELETSLPSLLAANPYHAFARAVTILHPQPCPPPGVHPTAVVDPTAELGEGVHVGALAVIGSGVRVGARTVIHPHVVLYPDVQVGEDCLLHSGVQVRERCRLGDRVVVQNGAVIGADGFGFAKDDQGRYLKIPQIGAVVVEDDVEIGALTAVDRASLGQTRIGPGTKIDNLVQIGHSVTIGRDSVLAGQVGIAGSTKVGDRVTLAGQVGVVGHISIGDGAIVTAQTGVPGDVEAGAVISGSPAIENRAWLKSIAVFARLPELQKRVRELERRLEVLVRR
ncbi:MAG TPA: UDP-3-O-(3-hydroxymyristoyl)glucosamine N-acyltransferase [Vicinamibacteria bacterium]